LTSDFYRVEEAATETEAQKIKDFLFRHCFSKAFQILIDFDPFR